MPPLTAAGWLGDDRPVFLAAEIGINHNGNLDLAHQMIDAAGQAGADGVKFQNFRAEDFISSADLTYEYQSADRTVRESQLEMFRRYELPGGSFAELKEHCEKSGVRFFSTPTSEEGVAELVDLGVELLKNGSDYLGHLDLISAMAKTGIPTVISTGMATESEVWDAIEAFTSSGGNELVLLHCTSVYPAPPAEVNLRRIPAMRAKFERPVGLSDHSEGIVAAVGAVALGACMIEKHFTLDRTLDGPDHRFSADPSEWRRLVDAVRTAELELGSSAAGPTPSELPGRRDYRLSCVATRHIEVGEVLERSDIAFKRPGTGIPPRQVDDLVGRKSTRVIETGHVFTEEDLG